MNDSHSHIHIEPPRMLVIAATGTLAILALFLFAELMYVSSEQQPVQNTITVEGTGKANATPDIATISYTVTESASTVADAQSAATTKSNDALEALKAEGIADADVRTTSYNVMPQYAQQVCPPGAMCPNVSSKINGYEVSESIEVKVRDLTKVGDVLQKLGDLGVQNISGPNFTQADDSTTHDQARAAAIADAQQNAATLAKQLGAHLGRVVSFQENNGGVVYPMYSAAGSSAMMDKAAAPNLPTGQNETDVTVSVTYEIK